MAHLIAFFQMTRKLRSILLIFILLLAPCLTSLAWAKAAGSGWLFLDAPPFSTSSEGLKGQDAEVYQEQTTLTPSDLTTSDDSATDATAEITELARALQHDPKLIYDYVHNHIDYVPYYGSLKGATLTYLDGSGNDFDQASLMIALLRQSGYTAKYVYGQVTISASDLINWLGANDGIYHLLASGGNRKSDKNTDGSYTINNIQVSNGSAIFDHVWIMVTINGITHYLDPSFKSYNYTDHIDISKVLGYTLDDLLTAAGGSSGTDYVEGLSATGIITKLKKYTTNIIDYINDYYANSPIEEIIGGRGIVQTHSSDYPSLPSNYSILDLLDEPPMAMTAKIHISHAGIDHTFTVPEIAGKRLSIRYIGANNSPQLFLDGVEVSGASGNATTVGAQYSCTIGIDHPYHQYNNSYCDQEDNSYKLKSGAAYAVVSGFAGMAEGLIQKRQRQLENLADTETEGKLEESLNIMGLTWVKECLLTERLLDALNDSVSIRHHMIGIMAQENYYYIDVKDSGESIIFKNDSKTYWAA